MQSPKDLKELQAFWYRKLKELGFEDIENVALSDRPLIQWHAHYFQQRHTSLGFSQQEEYYRLAAIWLHDHTFKTKTDKRIWELHAQGVGYRGIAKALKIKMWVVEHSVRHNQALMLGKKNDD